MISREKLIEDIKSRYCDSDFMDDGVIQVFIDVINEQPQVVNDTNVGSRREWYQKGYQDGLNADKWISCEERLPSEYGQYLYTDKNDEVHEGCYCPPLRGMIRGWSTCEADGYKRLSDKEIIAWQPLPQPYKKEGAV